MALYHVCIGINAYPRSPLSGCVNDALDWRGVLVAGGSTGEVLLDQDATRANILEALGGAARSLKRGDHLWVPFSGHGSSQRDASGEELDGRDEMICPVDIFTNGGILDDEIASVLGQRRWGTRVIFVPDSCFSGTMNKFLDTRQVPGAPKTLSPQDIPRRPKTRAETKLQSVVSFTGASSEQVAYDAWFSTRSNGAFTRTALDVLARAKPRTLKAWHKATVAAIPPEYPQTPQLDAALHQRYWKPFA